MTDSRFATYEHIHEVQRRIGSAITNLIHRALEHDQSKLRSPEVEIFDRCTERLAGLTYGSPEYQAQLAEMKPALDHHYAHNSHHPEHHQPPDDPWVERLQRSRDAIEFGQVGEWATDAVMVLDADLRSRRSPVRGMSLFDILEMLCDWDAATRRHQDGSILRSIEINQRRFGYSDELKQILLNTVAELGFAEPSG